MLNKAQHPACIGGPMLKPYHGVHLRMSAKVSVFFYHVKAAAEVLNNAQHPACIAAPMLKPPYHGAQSPSRSTLAGIEASIAAASPCSFDCLDCLDIIYYGIIQLCLAGETEGRRVGGAARRRCRMFSPALSAVPTLCRCPFAGETAFRELVEALGCPAAVQASAKSMFPETHPQYLGVYWGLISSQEVVKRLEAADAIIVAGGVRPAAASFSVCSCCWTDSLRHDVVFKYASTFSGEAAPPACRRQRQLVSLSAPRAFAAWQKSLPVCCCMPSNS